MIIVLTVNNEGHLNIQAEGGQEEQVLQALHAAANWITQQMSGPKLHLPNGQAKIVPLQSGLPGVGKKDDAE